MKPQKLLLIPILTINFGLLPQMQAVVPPPDGGYPGGNTAEGDSALAGLTSGFYNSAFGFLSLLSNGSASFNTGIGAGTLLANTASQNTAAGAGALLSNTVGFGNTANGAFALFSNTTGTDNTATGTAALVNNSTGNDNTAVGAFALNSNTTSGNTAIGAGALFNNTTGASNTATGNGALENNATGGENTANGAGALISNTTGFENTANGAFALFSNTEGNFNTATGDQALFNNTTGTENTANGALALSSNTTGGENTAIGQAALVGNETGSSNTAVGFGALSTNNAASNTAIGSSALSSNTQGEDNTALGTNALLNNITGNHNVALGSFAGFKVSTASNVICIGQNVGGADVDNSCFIGNIRGAVVAPDAAPVLIDSAGKLGTTNGSSRRFKEEIKRMGQASESILALNPVSFRYKSDDSKMPQFGLIAEEVAEVNPDLVVCDQDGNLTTVRYDAVNAMLLNEFLKEHRKVREQEATIMQLKKEMATVVARLKEQDAKIQTVSDRIELRKPAQQTASND